MREKKICSTDIESMQPLVSIGNGGASLSGDAGIAVPDNAVTAHSHSRHGKHADPVMNGLTPV
ncbi:MAG: hypothetical protein QGF90_16650 [Gammaproteobacteria bacterium]|nr:hypothetical protein [Gammaproteobacteria bacterium]